MTQSQLWTGSFWYTVIALIVFIALTWQGGKYRNWGDFLLTLVLSVLWFPVFLITLPDVCRKLKESRMKRKRFRKIMETYNEEKW